MESITQDKWLNFVINNYTDIIHLNEIFEHTKAKLPECVRLVISDSIMEIKDTFFSEQDVECSKENNVIYWYDPALYDRKKGKGLYFSCELESCSWKSFVPGGVENSPYLTLYVNSKRHVHTWAKVLEQHRKSLLKDGIGVNSEDDPQYLALYYLNKEISMEAMKDIYAFNISIQNAVKRFTNSLLPIIRNAS